MGEDCRSLMQLSAEEYLSAMRLHFYLWFDFVFCLCVVDTIIVMSFVNGIIQALISPNHIKTNSYQGIFSFSLEKAKQQ